MKILINLIELLVKNYSEFQKKSKNKKLIKCVFTYNDEVSGRSDDKYW